MSKVILFKESTNKNDLIRNNQNSIIGVLDEYTLSASIEYNLDSNHILTVLIDTELGRSVINQIGEKQILKVQGQNGVYDYFVITGVDKTLTNVEIVARHWTLEATSSIFILDTKPRNLNGINALIHVVKASEEYKQGKQFALDLELASNIDTLASFNIFHASLQEDLEKIRENFNGEIRRLGFQLGLVDYVGSRDVKYTVEYGVNLISNTTEESYEITTGVIGKGYDDLYSDIQYSPLLANNKDKTGNTVTIEYPIRVRVQGEDEDESYTYFDTEAEAKNELNRLAQLEFTNNKIDQPIITFSTEYVDLGTVDGTTETQTFLSVGDLVETKIPMYNLIINTRVVDFTYNILTGLIENVTLSNNNLGDLKAPTISDAINIINNIKIPESLTKDEVSSIAKQEAENYINGGIGGHVKIFPDEIYVLDQPKLDDATNLIRINKHGIAGTTNGVNGVYSVVIQNNGVIVADQIKAGVLSSLNNRSWINMLDGTFNFANRLTLEADGNVLFTGRISNIGTNTGTQINRGSTTFYARNNGGNLEQVGGIVSTVISATNDVNGVAIANSSLGEFIDIGGANANDISVGGVALTPIIRVCTNQNAYFNNFIGTQFLKPANVNDALYFGDTANSLRNRITGAGNQLSLAGESSSALSIVNNDGSYTARFAGIKTADAQGCTVQSYGRLNMNGQEIRRCPNVSSTFANRVTRTAHESSALYTQGTDTFRYVYKEVETNKDNKIILNIPNEYKGRKYTIVSVVKFGFGDYMVASQEENRFTIETDRPMKMNIEISIE